MEDGDLQAMPRMPEQLDMFGGGPELARQGIAQVLDHEDAHWKNTAMRNVSDYLRTHAEFCADDLYRYDLLPWEPHHKNAIGALVRGLIEHGYLEGPRRYINSERRAAQSRRIPVYGSKLYDRRLA